MRRNQEHDIKPTIVLIHGAFADASSFNGVIEPLSAEGHRVIAWANPLRSIAADAAALSLLVRSIDGPTLLVGHSYGGAVATNVDPAAGNVVGLVYVAGFALEAGESPGDASALAPGSTLADTLEGVPLADGGTDLYIAQDRFHQQFAADLPGGQAMAMAVTQRPVTEAASSSHPATVRCGARCRAGSSSVISTATSPPAPTTSWPSVRVPGAPSRSPGPRTSSASRTRTRPQGPSSRPPCRR